MKREKENAADRKAKKKKEKTAKQGLRSWKKFVGKCCEDRPGEFALPEPKSSQGAVLCALTSVHLTAAIGWFVQLHRQGLDQPLKPRPSHAPPRPTVPNDRDIAVTPQRHAETVAAIEAPDPQDGSGLDCDHRGGQDRLRVPDGWVIVPWTRGMS